jgi:hypothetical protein
VGLFSNAKIREGDLPDVERVQEEILSQFGEFLATAATAEDNNLLDYYECRFNSAFLTFRISAIRKEVARLKHLDDSGGMEDEPMKAPASRRADDSRT